MLPDDDPYDEQPDIGFCCSCGRLLQPDDPLTSTACADCLSKKETP